MLAIVLIATKWLSLAGIAAAGLMGYFGTGNLSPEAHYLTGLIAMLLLSLAQVMTVFYFIGMRTALRRACEAHGLDAEIVSEAERLRRQTGGLGYVVMLLATAALIIAGGALVGSIPVWIHPWLAIVTILLGIRTGMTEYRAFRRNAELFDTAATLIPSAASPPES